VQAIANAVVGAVTSYAAGNNALTGAAGAVSGELMAKQVMTQLYPGKTISELTETEKQRNRRYPHSAHWPQASLAA